MKALLKHYENGEVTETVLSFPLKLWYNNYNDKARKIVGTEIFETDIISVSIYEELKSGD